MDSASSNEPIIVEAYIVTYHSLEMVTESPGGKLWAQTTFDQEKPVSENVGNQAV